MIKKVDMTSSQADCGYSRLSSDRDGDKVGYEIQMDGSERWAERMDHTIAHWYKDPNVSAADENVYREAYEQMLADVEAGMWKGIIVWRMDRLTRLSYEFERCLKIVRKNGGYIISTDERLDSRNPQDVTMMKMKVIMGDNEAQSTKRRVKANKSRRLKAGLYKGGGRRPYGFEGPVHDDFGRVINTGRCGVTHVLDEVENLKDAARRIAWEGQSYLDVIHDWHDREPPIFGVTGAPWNIKTLEHMLTAPRMIGMQEWTDEESGEKGLVKAVWDPVLDERTWKRLASMRRRRDKPYNNRETYLLSNILRCGRCERPITGSQRTYLREGKQMLAARTYRCPSGSAYKARGSCGKLSVIADPVEKIVVGWVLARIKRTRGVITSVTDADDRTYELLDSLETKKAECEELMDELSLAWTKRKINMSEWMTAKGSLQEEADGYEAKMKSLSARLAVPTPVGRDYDDLRSWFEYLSFRQQRTLIEAYVEHVKVLPPGRSGRYFKPQRLVPHFSRLQVADGEGEDGGIGDLYGDPLVGA